MNKNMYPLMLSDDVVAAIDRLAYENGTNRSNMVNQILAEYVSYTTPEMRMHGIFSNVEKHLSGRDSFQILLQNSGSVFSLRSALAFKYNPNVRYTVELYRSFRGDSFGELRVSLRTQNANLILYLTQFYKLWIKLESAYNPRCEYILDGGKLTRKLKLDADDAQRLNEDGIGELIAGFITYFDRAMKAFFYNLDDAKAALEQTEKLVREYHRSAAAFI